MEFNSTVTEYTGAGESSYEKITIMNHLTLEVSIPLRHGPWTIVILLTAYLTVLVVGLMGNVFVIVVVLKIPKMKTATKYFILNLAVADLLVLLFCLLPNLISNIYVPWVMGSFMCKAVPYVQGVSVCASVYSLAAISGDRLMAVRSPLRRQVTKSVALRIIVLIWMWAAGLALPWLLYFDLLNADGPEASLVFCVENWPPGMNGNTYFVLGNLGLCYLVPLCFISFCDLSIWLRMRRRKLTTHEAVSQRQLGHRTAKASVQKLVIVVVFVFAGCWLPLYVIFVRVKLIPAVLGTTEEKVLDYALPIAQWLGAANSCINPILYAFFNRNFCYTLQRLLGRSLAHSIPRNRLDPQHNHHLNPGRGPKLKSVRLRITHHLGDRKKCQLKNSCHNAVDSSDECNVNVITLHPTNPNLAVITRSETYQAAMANPW